MTDKHSERSLTQARVFITGCGGMLGNYTYPFAKQICRTVLATDKNLTEPWLEHLDVRDYAKLSQIFKEIKPTLVLHLAAETDCEVCEADPYLSWEVNVRATREIALLCRNYSAIMVFISTAAVFPGEQKAPFTETDRPSPTMSYGFHKLEAEHHVRSISDKHYIFRAGWMMGAGPKKDKKYTAKILRQIIEDRPVIYAVTDKQGIPGYTKDFARNMLAMAETENYGTYHMVCSGGVGTRYDVAKEILMVCGRTDIELREVDSSFFDKEYFAPRPSSEAMVNVNLNKIGMNLQRRWQDVLREYIPAEWPHAIGQAQST
ncbi:MAG: NAD(P)-dependent oxidoreductase [Gammaproteobacteria bacterium]|nr:NAD(P)-dependent oxidoreductase [Gammaproteobacteria bacterium]